MRGGLAGFSRPSLFLISGRDLTAQEFMALAESPRWASAMRRSTVGVERLPGADHTFSSKQDLRDASARIVGWLARL
jgi:hypothetical protein